MGIRSQVGFCIAKKEGRIIPDFNNIEADFKFDVVKENDDAILYVAHDVKWYDISDEDGNNLFKAVDEYLDSLDNDDDGDSGYIFVELCEGETNTRGDYWDNPFDFGYVFELTYHE